MSEIVWKPHCTVAAVIEREGRYLLVEERTDRGLEFNQPAGHMEHGESLLQACVRETREETGYGVAPESLVGVYQWSPAGQGDKTFLRFAYAASVQTEPPAGHALDADIVRAVWLTYDEVLACRDRHRSPLLLQCIDDYRAGRRYPLDLIRHHD